jgi:hypothetical protein
MILMKNILKDLENQIGQGLAAHLQDLKWAGLHIDLVRSIIPLVYVPTNPSFSTKQSGA